MNTQINYNGLSTIPSDYDCPDGDLDLSINLIHEDGALRPIPEPTPLLTLLDGEKALFIHNVIPNQENFILSRPVEGEENRVSLCWVEKDPEVNTTSGATPIGTFDTVHDISAIGNTLILATASGLIHILWKDEAYSVLGERPPFVAINFGLSRAFNSTAIPVNEKFTLPETLRPGQRMKASDGDIELWTNFIFGRLNSHVADIISNGYFYQPFFVRYAFRLFDGSYAWHSAPILMLPTVLPPAVTTKKESEDAWDVEAIAAVPYCTLMYHILSDVSTRLLKWEDIISAIDVFVSAPIYTYDASAPLKNMPLIISRRQQLLNCLPAELKVPGRPGTDGVSQSTIPTQIYNSSIYDGTGYSAEYYPLDDNCESWKVANIPRRKDFFEAIRSAHEFYRIASLPIKELAAPADGMQPVPLENEDLSQLVTRPRLPDEFRTHSRIRATLLYEFNSRLNLAGVSVIPAEPLPIRATIDHNPTETGVTYVDVTVWSRINGVKTVATVHDPFPVFLGPGATSLPVRYIYVPEPSAYKIEIRRRAGSVPIFRADLVPHDFLNGAYFFDEKFDLPSPLRAATESTVGCATSVPALSKIYTSDVNNPFIFPATGINTVGSGHVIALSSAVRALSQGQFGQFPLYAFTSEGVWALETNATGSYSACQPISRDVCFGADSVTQIDSAVLFATSRGVMLISGSQIQCLTEIINRDHSIEPFSLPGLKKLQSALLDAHAEVNNADPLPAFSLKPFREFLSGSRMIYDYPSQRIFLFNPSAPYAYVYSLRSQRWGMVLSRLSYSLNSYPESLAVDSFGRVVSLSTDNRDSTSYPGLLLSRPISLGEPDVLKTIRSVIQRGLFHFGTVYSLLLGSRDLFHWHVVWSGFDHRLRGFSGTPYKFFRVALLTALDQSEAISAASIQLLPRLTNKPR